MDYRTTEPRATGPGGKMQRQTKRKGWGEARGTPSGGYLVVNPLAPLETLMIFDLQAVNSAVRKGYPTR